MANLKVGDKMSWKRDYKWAEPEVVTVAAELSRGQFRLSNGWTVDSDGFAEGTRSVRGGIATPLEGEEASK